MLREGQGWEGQGEGGGYGKGEGQGDEESKRDGEGEGKVEGGNVLALRSLSKLHDNLSPKGRSLILIP